MGWTVYWDYSKEKNVSSFPETFVDEVKQIINKAKKKVQLGVWDGSGPATLDTICSNHGIIFNGINPESCETFCLKPCDPRGLGGDFCKTRGYPYSIVCIAVLEAAVKAGIIPEYSMDGGPEKEEVMQLYNTVFENS